MNQEIKVNPYYEVHLTCTRCKANGSLLQMQNHQCPPNYELLKRCQKFISSQLNGTDLVSVYEMKEILIEIEQALKNEPRL